MNISDMLFFEEYRQQTTVNKREGRERSENQKSQKNQIWISNEVFVEKNLYKILKKAEK